MVAKYNEGKWVKTKGLKIKEYINKQIVQIMTTTKQQLTCVCLSPVNFIKNVRS